MNCRKFQELITTDYIDGQLDPEAMERVRAHIGACTLCAAYEKSLRKAAVEPFKKIKEIRPAPSVWERIREDIAVQGAQQEEGVFTRLRDLVRPVFEMPKPVYAAIALAVFAITAAVIVNWRMDTQLNRYVQEQADFLHSLDHTAGNPGSFGTAIEQFYL